MHIALLGWVRAAGDHALAVWGCLRDGLPRGGLLPSASWRRRHGGIEQSLARWAIEPRWLRLELTESSLMVDPARALESLAQLRGLGVKLSVDDYGTGYSSLRHRQQLPLDELKIDRSFVRTMVNNPSDLTIVRSTIDLAHALGLQVVAEGVEDAATWLRLGQLGCDQAQGYFISRPLPSSDLLNWLRERVDWRQTDLAA
jgi:EAL domain-containing protein (putative c-di-GMP-specific phosphodiesterase class I)